MAQRSSSEQRERRGKARERRRSLAAEPFEQMDEKAGSEEAQRDDGKGASALKQAAATAVAGAVAAGIAGAAKAMRDRREDDDGSAPKADEAPGEEREDSAAEEADQPVGEASAPEDEGAQSPGEGDGGHEGDSGEDPQGTGGSQRGSRPEQPSNDDAPLRGASGGDAKEIVDKARQELQELLGVEPESVSGFERSNGRWTVMLEVVDVRRIPESTDVLSSYEVAFDDDLNLVSVAQKRRYRRSQVEEAR